MTSIELKSKIEGYFIKLAYRGFMDSEINSLEHITPLIESSRHNKTNFGWALFEQFTSNADNCRSEVYPQIIERLEIFFRLFPENQSLLKKTYNSMIANMILGKGNTGFIIRDKEELDAFLSDFGKFGFTSSITRICIALFDKRVMRDNLVPERLFSILSPFLDFEKDIDHLFQTKLAPPLIIALLSEKVLNDPDYRFKEKKDYNLLNEILADAKKKPTKNLDDHRERCNLFLDAILVALAYEEERTINYSFSHFFYNSGSFYRRTRNMNISLICFDYARKFFKLLGNKRYTLYSEAYYYRYLSEFYERERRFYEQEIALSKTVLAYKSLLDLDQEKFSQPYYQSFLRLLFVKAENSLFDSDFDECVEVVNLFLEKKEIFISNLGDDYTNDSIKTMMAFKFESEGRNQFKKENLKQAIANLGKAYTMYDQLPDEKFFSTKFSLNRLINYYRAKQRDSDGEYNEAFAIMGSIIDNYKETGDTKEEFLRFHGYLNAKILLMNGDIDESIVEFERILERSKAQGDYDEIIEKIEKLYPLLKQVDLDDLIPENIDSYISNLDDQTPYVIEISEKSIELPIRSISSEKLKINLQNDFTLHIIRNYERNLNISFPITNSKFYHILENIVLGNLEEHPSTNELIRSIKEKGQLEPLILSHEGVVIDGNKRILAFKLSKKLSETKNISPIDFNCVKIIKFPETLSETEIALLKTRLRIKPIVDIKTKQIKDIDRLIVVKNLLKIGLNETEISLLINQKGEDVQTFRDLYDLIEEFLEEERFSEELYVIEKHRMFELFKTLNKELQKINEYLGIEGTKLIELKRKIKKISFIWFKNSIDGQMISEGYLVRSIHIRKLKYLLLKSKYQKTIIKILEGEINDKEQIHKILENLTEKIILKEEKRSNTDHAKLLYDRVKFLKEKIQHKRPKPEEKEEIISYLQSSLSEINILIKKF